MGRLSRLLNPILTRRGYRITPIWEPPDPFGVDPLRDLRRWVGQTDQVTIIDVGANVGQTAKRFASAFPKSKIYSFEPFSKTFATLRERTQSDPNVKIFNHACGAKSERLRVPIRPDYDQHLNSLDAQNHRLFIASAWDEIEVITLDSFGEEMKLKTIDILKTDTEGYDLEVLKGAERLLGEGRVRYVLSECEFARVGDESHTNFFALHEFLQARKFRLVSLYTELTSPTGFHWGNALFCANPGQAGTV
jgi:FkbM family methyltransferase